MVEACNIGGRGIRKRIWIGIPLIAIGIVWSMLSRSFFAQVVAFFGFLSLYQALDST
jgi:hypothetical protein